MMTTVSRETEHESVDEAAAWFEALDQKVIGRGEQSWTTSVLSVRRDDRDWWIDVATASDPSANIVLRLSRRATVFHAIAALRRHRPRIESAAVVEVMRVTS